MKLLFLVIAILYFIPAIIAFARGHHNKIAIAALNVLLGWSVIGWVGALVWSLMSARPQSVVVQAPGRI